VSLRHCPLTSGLHCPELGRRHRFDAWLRNGPTSWGSESRQCGFCRCVEWRGPTLFEQLRVRPIVSITNRW
jgi:hypothetical protein